MDHERVIDYRVLAWNAMKRYGFNPGFPKSLIRDTKKNISSVSPCNTQEIKDFRGLLWSSIDNFDSMDLDQIEYCETDEDGSIHVFIAISDVDRYVRKGSRLDMHARMNGASVYAGIETFPMPPDLLSKDISSLLPGNDHIAIVVDYHVEKNGTIRPGSVCRALVCNKSKLIYEEIGDWLKDLGEVPHVITTIPGLKEQILLQYRAALLMRAHRMKEGALDLETLEVSVKMDQGKITGLEVIKENEARSLIEEFMVAANETIVQYLKEASVPMIERIVRVPKYWDSIQNIARLYGVNLPDNPDAKSLSRFLAMRKKADPERFSDLSTMVVKLIGSGEYVAYVPGKVPVGHFALAVKDYTHGTAPNRRYSDLVIQRLIKSAMRREKSAYTVQELSTIAFSLTKREHESKKVERFGRKVAAAIILHKRIGEVFPAYVTGASEKGTYARLIIPPAEGRVVKGEHGAFIGEKVRVRLLHTDPWNGHVDFEIIGRDQEIIKKSDKGAEL